VHTLLTEVLRRYDSILEVLGGTGGGIVLGASGGINIDDTCGNGDGSTVLDAGVGIVLESEARGGSFTSVGTSSTRRGTQDDMLLHAHDGDTSGDDGVVLLADGGFRWPVGRPLATGVRGAVAHSGALI
jgi:hypothetical protein